MLSLSSAFETVLSESVFGPFPTDTQKCIVAPMPRYFACARALESAKNLAASIVEDATGLEVRKGLRRNEEHVLELIYNSSLPLHRDGRNFTYDCCSEISCCPTRKITQMLNIFGFELVMFYLKRFLPGVLCRQFLPIGRIHGVSKTRTRELPKCKLPKI